MSPGSAEGEFLDQFDPEELTEESVGFDLGPQVRCTQKMLLHRNRVVWFSIVVMVSDRGVWTTVVRADTCHHEAHVHRFVRGRHSEVRRRVLRTISTIEDVEEGFDHACDLLVDQWEENVRRWRTDG